MAKRIKIGRYNLGCHTVNLYGDPVYNGASFQMGKDEIVIGLNHRDWPSVVNTTLHEAIEFSCTGLGLRHKPTPDYAGDSGSYLFVMDHAQFSEAVARAAWFLADCLPDLARAYKKK